MSEEQSNNQPHESEWECGMCGRDGGPVAECDLCKGAPRFAQQRHYTLSEERRGMNKEEKSNRYGSYGEVMPKIIDLPGSANPFRPNKQ